MPVITDARLSAEGGVGGDYLSARVDVSFAVGFGPAERETSYRLYAHVVEQSEDLHGEQETFALIADLNAAVCRVTWTHELDNDASRAVWLYPRGRERLDRHVSCVLDFAQVVDLGSGLESLWRLDDRPLWCLEITAWPRRGPGCVFVSDPFVWNPLSVPVPRRGLVPARPEPRPEVRADNAASRSRGRPGA